MIRLRPPAPALWSFAALLVATAAGVNSGRLSAQQNAPQRSSATPAGLETPWDVRKILIDLDASNAQLKPLLAEMNPQKWYDEKGAPTTYILQWQTAQQQVNDVLTVSKQLASKTEDLPLAMDTYFRIEALEVSTRSLSEGLQKYGDRAQAGKLAQLLAQNFNSRERFRDYLRDLAVSTEQNFKVADEEAQRCRGMISKDPPKSLPKKAKRN